MVEKGKNQMLKRHLYLIALGILQFITFRSAGQMTMPDHVCTGQTRHYYVIPGPVTGSTYTWWVDGSVMSGFNDSEFIYTWNSSNTFLLEVQESSADGCPGPKKSGRVYVNPRPEIQISSSDSLICDGESVTVSVKNPAGLIWGKWIYDLIVEPEAGITGNTINGTYTSPTDVNETLHNNDTAVHKVDYRFIPRIVTDDGVQACEGKEVKITLWVHPGLRYKKEVSDYNGFNISCYGKSDGFIGINPSDSLAPYTFSWSGPKGFIASTKDISGLTAGHYFLTITDDNNCTVKERFDLTEPAKLSMAIEPSASFDGNYNIDCSEAQTGYVNLLALNNIGQVEYLWIDGYLGSSRSNMSAGTYKIILTDSNNCHADTTITLTEPDPIRISFDITDPFCPDSRDGEIRLSVTGGVTTDDYIYNWRDNSTGRNLSNITEGLYVVNVTDMTGCTLTDSVKLRSMNEICIIIPDAFSPNGDGTNDVWRIENIDLYPKVEITIYNRWGNALWQSDPGYPVHWNGKSRGEDLPIDTYHYFIDLKNGSKPFIGDVTIVR